MDTDRALEMVETVGSGLTCTEDNLPTAMLTLAAEVRRLRENAARDLTTMAEYSARIAKLERVVNAAIKWRWSETPTTKRKLLGAVISFEEDTP